ncbi:hypothetical protein BH10ACT9_BH10ACT9_28670 [soil metagenome]|jgi:hypothetical protein
MRADEGDESIEELAKDAAKTQDKIEETLEDDGAPESKPKHRRD